MSEKTVAAISSPMGVGGIGVIRISGEEAIDVADRCFKAFSGKPLSSLPGYRAAYGRVLSEDGSEIDEAVALVFRAPKSYTGENVVEITVHGGIEVLKASLRRVFECGAAAAENGEFTKRAFLNGKMPLSKAESVMELINARSDAALKISRSAAGGSIDRAVSEITELLKKTAAGLGVFSDFPDEELEGAREEDFRAYLDECEQKLRTLLNNYDSGKLLREGIDCAIVGKPNVGKSTLMNLLCGSERSIVTSVAGTTRDIVEHTVNLGEITLNLSDTAGIRDTDDIVENFGVKKARDRIENASLILAVFDTSAPLDGEDLSLLEEIKERKSIIVLNKSDLGNSVDSRSFEGLPTVTVSAKESTGLSELSKVISEVCSLSHLSENDAVLISERQRGCAASALSSVLAAKEALAGGMTLDAVGVCADDALSALLELTGERVTNAVTDEIFKRFCVGK